MKKALLLALAVAVLSSGCLMKSQTLDAMIYAAEAIKNRNFDEFDQYVDTEALIEQMVDLTIEQMRQHVKRYGKLFDNAANLGRPLVVQQTKKALKLAVNKGAVTRLAPELKDLPSAALLTTVVDLFGAPKSDENYNIVEVKEGNDTESLKVKVRTGKDEWLPLHLLSKRVGDHYRITKIVNLDDIAPTLLKLAGLP
jgi:hypothetical protein